MSTSSSRPIRINYSSYYYQLPMYNKIYWLLIRMCLTQVFGHAKVQHHLQDRTDLVPAGTYLFHFHPHALTYTSGNSKSYHLFNMEKYMVVFSPTRQYVKLYWSIRVRIWTGVDYWTWDPIGSVEIVSNDLQCPPRACPTQTQTGHR